MSKDHITIGLLSHYVADAVRAPIVEAFHDTGTEEAVRAVVFLPHQFNEGPGSSRDVLRLIVPTNLDGLIVVNKHTDRITKDLALCRESVPILTINTRHPDLPVVEPDRDSALRGALEHLLDCHGYRRIGLIADRKNDVEIMRDMLDRYGVAFDPSMALPRNTARAAGILKSKRGLSRPQAVVVGTGVLGRKLVADLQGEGVLVPHDIAVIAADTIVGEQQQPALTTCGATAYTVARQATRMMIDHIRNDSPLESHRCAVQLYLQESCGCNRLHIWRDSNADLNSIRSRITALAEEDDAIALGLGLSADGPEWVGKAFDALVSDVSTAQRDFSAVLNRMLNHPRRVENRDVSVRRALWLLQREVFATVDPDSKPGQRSRRILRRAWKTLGTGLGMEAVATGFHASRLERDRCSRAFRSMTYQPDWDGLLDAVRKGMKFVGIDRMYVCLRKDPGTPPRAEDIFLALDDGERLDIPEDFEFDPAVEIFPRELFGDEPPGPYSVLSLYDHWEDAYHGFVAIAGRHSGLILETMREGLSNGCATALSHRNKLEAMANVRALEGLIPICAACKKMRDDKGYWQQLEKYISENSEARLTHSFCPECARKMMADAENVIVTNRIKR